MRKWEVESINRIITLQDNVIREKINMELTGLLFDRYKDNIATGMLLYII